MSHRRFVSPLPIAVATLVATVLATPIAATAAANGDVRPAIANPASVACGARGGRLEIRSGEGGETGWCHLPDGRICEEWALFRDDRCVPPPAPPTAPAAVPPPAAKP
jgi:putative hemolysin